jgi:shikimate dehydrogenase
MTDRYAVIGNPVAHSKSPLIHAEFARQTGEDIEYGKLHVELADFEAAVERFRAEGGRGLNVTVPFKHRAYALAARHSGRAEEAGAANTLKLDGADLEADNTDGVGLVRDLVKNLGCKITGRRLLLMGAGGASYGVAGPLLDEKPAAVTFVNRAPDKAAAMAQRFALAHAGIPISAVSYDELSGHAFDVIVNATSAGLSGELPPLPGSAFAPGALAYEMMYGRSTPFVELAVRAGARTADGLGMLVEQAAESFYVWRGVRPETAPVIALLRAGAAG